MKRLIILLVATTLVFTACDSTAVQQSGSEGTQVAEAQAAFHPEITVESTVVQGTRPSTNTTTNTPAPTATSQSTPRATLTIAKLEPYPGAPECTDHDDTQWHGLWNADAGCHYDHTHNADPFATQFAEYVTAWDQSISYPWQTPHENAMKHAGYKYAYNVDPDCSKRLDERDNCVEASLIQLHAVGSQLGITTRFHSYRAIALISNGVDDEPGIIELGGHSDFGILHCPYKKAHCPLSSDPANSNFDMMWSHPPYRASTSLDRLARDMANGKITQAWNSGWQPVMRQFYPVPYNLLFEYDFQSVDAWGAVNVDDPTEIQLVCPNGDCPYNHSTLRVYEIVIRVPEELAGPDGRVNFAGFADVQGNIDINCTEAGPDCVPLIIENTPVGQATFSLPISHVPLTEFLDYDIYFDGVTSGWIQYPN